MNQVGRTKGESRNFASIYSPSTLCARRGEKESTFALDSRFLLPQLRIALAKTHIGAPICAGWPAQRTGFTLQRSGNCRIWARQKRHQRHRQLNCKALDDIKQFGAAIKLVRFGIFDIWWNTDAGRSREPLLASSDLSAGHLLLVAARLGPCSRRSVHRAARTPKAKLEKANNIMQQKAPFTLSILSATQLRTLRNLNAPRPADTRTNSDKRNLCIRHALPSWQRNSSCAKIFRCARPAEGRAGMLDALDLF